MENRNKYFPQRSSNGFAGQKNHVKRKEYLENEWFNSLRKKQKRLEKEKKRFARKPNRGFLKKNQDIKTVIGVNTRPRWLVSRCPAMPMKRENMRLKWE